VLTLNLQLLSLRKSRVFVRLPVAGSYVGSGDGERPRTGSMPSSKLVVDQFVSDFFDAKARPERVHLRHAQCVRIDEFRNTYKTNDDDE
jgi:hypothetical protein